MGTKIITIVNAHWNNRGDEAALLALVEGLKKRSSDNKITIIFKDGQSVEQFPNIEGVDYYPAKFNAKIWDIWLTTITRGLIGRNPLLKKTVRTLRDSDLIIYSPGGSVINDRFYWRKQMEYLIPFICAKFYKIPLFIAAPSIGPFEVQKPNRIRKWLLETPDIMCVREEISREYLKTIGIQKNVHVTIDFAFLNEIDLIANERKLGEYKKLHDFLNSHEKVVGITITDFKWHVKLNKEKELLIRIEDAFHKFVDFIEDQGYGVLFIPQLFGNQNDFHYMEKYCGINSFIMDDTMDNYFQQYIISKLYAVVGMRYHSNIFAAKMGTPFLAVVYEEKMEGFIDMANLNEYSIPLSEISFEKLDEKFKKIEQNHELINQNLQKDLFIWRNKAGKTMELLDSLQVMR